MKRHPTEEPRFSGIDAVLYISEKHVQLLPDGRLAFSTGIFEAAGTENFPWKVQVVDYIVDKWSRTQTGGPIVESKDFHNFETVDDIPKQMSRDEHWRLEYKRTPYLGGLTTEQLRVQFHRAFALNSLSFLKGSWTKPPKEETAKALRRFQDIIEETNRRGLDMRFFDRNLLSSEEKMKIYQGLPPELVSMLSGE